MIIRSLGFIFFLFFNISVFGQGTITGNFRLNGDFYDRDTAIATLGPNYDYNKSSANAWFQVMYSNRELGFDAGIRLDGNYNSILQNPPNPVSFYGIGNWYIKKKIDKLEVQGGYIYEQYGSGIALRTFEERNLGIDNALFGVKARYQLDETFAIRAIAGTQKYQLGYFESFIKGLNLEGNHTVNDSFSFNFGASFVNRTLNLADRQKIDNTISTYNNADYFVAPYNAYVIHAYNTIQFSKYTVYLEGAYKTKDAVFNGQTNKYSNKAGLSLLGSFSYAKPGLGVTWQTRYVDHFQFQSTAEGAANNFNLNNNRRLAFIAPINRQNSLRLPARFQIAPQDIGEFGSSIDVTYSPAKKTHINLNICVIDSTGFQFKNPYYGEFYIDIERKKWLGGKLDQHFGFQFIHYNQQKYLGGTEPNDIKAFTVFTESTYRIDRKKSLRFELQYQHAAKELGQSIFALAEFNIAPNWSFSVSDLYNFKPNPEYEVVKQYQEPHHFYTFFTSYTKGSTRFTLSYAKQLAGIVCTGGVCRFEPAFSGLRAQLTSSF